MNEFSKVYMKIRAGKFFVNFIIASPRLHKKIIGVHLLLEQRPDFIIRKKLKKNL